MPDNDKNPFGRHKPNRNIHPLQRACRSGVLLLAAMLSLATQAGAAWSIPFISGPGPQVDGLIDADEWGEALQITGLYGGNGVLEDREARVWIASDGEHLYLAVQSELPHEGGLLARAQPVGERNRPQVYYDDNVEIWLDPAPHHSQKPVFRLAVNPRDAVYTSLGGRTDGFKNLAEGWRRGWQIASRTTDTHWELEAVFKLAAVGLTIDHLQAGIGLSVLRNWQQPKARGMLAEPLPAVDGPVLPGIRWSQDGVVPRITALRPSDRAGVNLSVELLNPTPRPQTININLYHQASENPPFELNETYTLPPGGREEILVEEGFNTGYCQSNISLGINDEITFERRFDWYIERPVRLWTAARESLDAVRLDFGFYPYFGKVKARLDVGALNARSNVSGAELKVLDASGVVIAAEYFPPFANYQSEFIMDLPELEGGDYQVVATLQGEGLPSGEITDRFTRQFFEWEHNTLGITDEVVPPFTPMKVDGRRISTVLRDHALGDLGLWDQVISDGRPILAGPMYFDIEVAGKRYQTEVIEPVRFSQTDKHKVAYTSRWQAGPLRGRIVAEHEFDGVLKIELDLEQQGDALVDKLDLVIPLRSDIARLMHPVTTGTRRHYAGYVPAGEGLLWQSSEAHRRALPGTFVPYIWVGDESRGLAWFAESDRDWIFDDIQSTHRLYRDGDQIVLRVSFVTRPAPLDRPRQIVFGLQATPTKPMPEEPVNWRNWQQRASDKFVERNFNVFFLAGSATWGTAGGANFVYPRDRDFSIFELLRDTRETGQRDLQREQLWLDGDDIDDGRFDSRRSHILWGLRAMESQPDAVVPYTNPRGAVVNPEFITFQDEWNSNAYASRRWHEPIRGRSSGGTYVMTPTRSFQDYEIWYFKKMLETFADAIYYDCLYLRQNHDLVTGAYLADDGTLRPSADIWQLREYLRRIQTLTWQMGRNWLTSMSHMTNTQIAPTNTWAGINLEWEIGYSMRTFQDRFSRDEIRTTAIGKQTGSVPQVLGTTGIRGAATPEHEALVRRSLAGVSAVHELKDIRSAGDVSGEVYGRLFDFGYGLPECRVFRYWDEDFPVSIEGLDAASLLLVNDGAALILVVDYGDGGEAIVRIDPRELGLPPGGHFVDLESGKRLPAAGDFGFYIELPRHDFKMVGYRYQP